MVLTMTYRAGDVRPGKCFATGGEARLQVRRVISVVNGMVAYEARDPKSRKGVWSARAEIAMEPFLSEAAREVGCDYTG